MKSITKKNLVEIYNREKLFLNNAIKNGNDPYHIFSLSTINKNFSDSRMVVLRNIDMSPLKIYFNIDKRSPKAKQLSDSKYCTALFYNQQRRVQLRLKCSIVIHNNNLISKKIWSKTPLQSKKCYMGPYKPSQELQKWHPNVPIKYIDKDPKLSDSIKGYKNFLHIELVVNKIDILELHYDGHIRFQVDENEKMFFISP